ncbi:unnamed protein product [Caenorhabditis sp. 36 PRJEB53466]|nr:unnamed protein product [Caenorhabditis sp. 36 PRJEB53466]
MDKNRLMVVLATIALLGVTTTTTAVEIKDGAFPTGTDYQKEKETQGQDPANYKKVYHRVIPGGHEHAEVVASNGPGSNSWSQTYSKHQSFGSADTVQSQSYSSSNGNAAKNAVQKTAAEKIRNSIEKAHKDAMARHNEIMSSIQQSMGMGLGGMGMGGIGMPSPFGSSDPKITYYDGFEQWMKGHVRMMNEMMRMQNAHMQALERLIAASSYPAKSETAPRLHDSEAVAEAVESLADSEKRRLR